MSVKENITNEVNSSLRDEYMQSEIDKNKAKQEKNETTKRNSNIKTIFLVLFLIVSILGVAFVAFKIGNVCDEAQNTLQGIRKDISEVKTQVNDSLDQITKDAGEITRSINTSLYKINEKDGVLDKFKTTLQKADTTMQSINEVMQKLKK